MRMDRIPALVSLLYDERAMAPVAPRRAPSGWQAWCDGWYRRWRLRGAIRLGAGGVRRSAGG